MRIIPLLTAATVALALAGCVTNDPNSPTNNVAVRTLGGAAVGAVVANATGGSGRKGALIGGGGALLSCTGVIPGVSGC